MIKHLYDSFAEKYYHGGSIYIYSDPHFSDEDSYRFRFPEEFDCDDLEGVSEETKRTANKVTVQHLDQMQIDNINKVAHKNDTLIILGDVGNVECVKKLKAGYKVLIMGNHDAGASNYKRVIQKDFSEVSFEELMRGDRTHLKIEDNHLFDEVYEGTLQIGPKLILSHEPVEYPYCLNIHGHVHRVNPLGAYTEGINCTSHYNCCAEQINYKPVCLKNITESGALKLVFDIHRVTIDGATVRKRRRDADGEESN